MARTEQIGTWVTPELKQLAREAAARGKVSLSTWLYQLVSRELEGS